MRRLMRIFEHLLDRFLTMLNPRRTRKRKRVTMRYLMLLFLAAVFATPCIELIFKPMP
ncbi:MAG TPA: hypothetical protein VNN25_21720 [Thermoanaerobaculia bacterium]|nr:hypothetical protein [Thermoanaerobaculia bacterium]